MYQILDFEKACLALLMWLSKTYDNKLAGTLLRLGNRPISISEGLESMGEKMGVASGLTIKVAYLLGRTAAAARLYYRRGLVCNLLSLQGIDIVGSNSKGGLCILGCPTIIIKN